MARHRFGSRLRILQTLGTKDPSRLHFNNCPGIEADYQSGVEPPHSKGYADLILWARFNNLARFYVRRRSAINAVITTALMFFFVLASTYDGVWVAIQIVKEIIENRRRRF